MPTLLMQRIRFARGELGPDFITRDIGGDHRLVIVLGDRLGAIGLAHNRAQLGIGRQRLDRPLDYAGIAGI